MRKIKSKCGYTVYEVTAAEVSRLGGFGICDECNEFASKGYLIPVLNHYQCPKCYADWNERAVYYEADIPHEQRVSEYYEEIISLEGE